MRRNCKMCAALLVANLFLFHIQAQTTLDTSSVKKSNTEKPNVWYTLFSFNTQFVSGSNGMNQYMMNRLGLGGYISSESIESAEKRIKNRNRAGVYSSTFLSICIKKDVLSEERKRWRLRPSYLVLRQENVLGASFSKGAWQMLFRGNDPYLGETLNIGGTGLTQFASRTALVRFNNVYQSENKNMGFGFSAGLSQLMAWRSMEIFKGSIYTESNRNFVDVQYDLSYKNTGRSDFPGKGIGFLTEWTFHKKKEKKIISFHVQNLGFYSVKNADHLQKQMDTAVRIKQSTIGFKNPSPDNWTEYFRDTVNRAVSPDSSKFSGIIFAPFTMRIRFVVNNYFLDLDYLYIKGYLPRLTLYKSPLPLFKTNFSITPELQLGGFDTYNLNVGFGYPRITRSSAKSALQAYVKFTGIEAFFLPKLEHGAGISFGLSCLVH